MEASKGKSHPPNKNERKLKSCKGWLYYSSIRNSNSKNNPTCFGISQTFHQFPSHIVGKADLDKSKLRTNLSNFNYTCLGYSIYLDNKNISANSHKQVSKFPICVAGLEMLINEKPPESPVDHDPAPAYKSEENEHTSTPQPQSSKPQHFKGENFFNRFIRNASIVASGVAKNLNRVGNYVKDTVDDTLNPERKRPK
ncbi:uncharacterized protein [Cicer arietinum]|uniref:Uncharacterized protein LOC101503051 n=1 Tax=Cicer arietinum TaxID=3827 RepID=A0A1S2Z5I9_CICAR|nr:uncharacterized protein LOC101503051 [Cicer arietinum]